MRVAVALAVVFGFGGSCLAQQSSFSQKGDYPWIALASRQAEDEAIGVARAYRFQFPTVRVVQATNGWFAVVAGPERVPNAKARKEQLLNLCPQASADRGSETSRRLLSHVPALGPPRVERSEAAAEGEDFTDARSMGADGQSNDRRARPCAPLDGIYPSRAAAYVSLTRPVD